MRRRSVTGSGLSVLVFHADPLTCRKCGGKLKNEAYLHDQVARLAVESAFTRKMTARELVEQTSAHPLGLFAFSAMVPLLAGLAGLLQGARPLAGSAWRYVYAVLVYLACVPGVGAAVLTAYTLFFTGENLLDKDLLVYLLPVVSMVATLFLVRRRVAFDDVPGFDRLAGLMTVIALTFGMLLTIRKTVIGIFFGASLSKLAVLAAGVFALLQWGAHAVFRPASEPRRPPPGMPPL